MLTLKQMEGAPVDYPTIDGLSAEAAELNLSALWMRIESHVSYRWSAREVVWIVEGCGEWSPPLLPVFIDDSYRWTGEAWAPYTLAPSPLGYQLPDGQFMINATVGNGVTVSSDVAEAFRRFAEYLVSVEHNPVPAGASRYHLSLGPALNEETHRSPNYIARALVQSGAADLLRRYRRV